MNKYTFVIKEGKNKKHIIDWVYAPTRKAAEAKMEQSLIDAGVLVKAAGYTFVRNYVIKTDKEA
jgi:hypothetical protein